MRGWITEEDERVTLGADGRPRLIAIRGYTDFRQSCAKMVGLVGRLHQAGQTNPEALQIATIVPARMTGMDDRVGSIVPGKTADVILVDGDVSRDLANLRHVDTVFLDGYLLDGAALRQAAGLTGCRDKAGNGAIQSFE